MSIGCLPSSRSRWAMSITVRPFHCRPILDVSLSKMAMMSKPALAEPAVLDQRAADLPRPDHPHPIAPLEAQDLAQLVGQIRHRIAQAPLAEGAEERQVLPHLRGRRPAARGERARTHRGDALPLELLEKAEIQRQPANRGLGDFRHDAHFCETFHKVTAPSTPRQRARAAAPRTRPARPSPDGRWRLSRPGRAPPPPAPRPTR